MVRSQSHCDACGHPTITGAGTGTFEFESATGVYTELQCGSYIFRGADYDRNSDRDGAPTRAFEPSPFARATVNLYDWYVCIRANRVEQLWSITARGAVY
jgi:hypothetical protein